MLWETSELKFTSLHTHITIDLHPRELMLPSSAAYTNLSQYHNPLAKGANTESNAAILHSHVTGTIDLRYLSSHMRLIIISIYHNVVSRNNVGINQVHTNMTKLQDNRLQVTVQLKYKLYFY